MSESFEVMNLEQRDSVRQVERLLVFNEQELVYYSEGFSRFQFLVQDNERTVKAIHNGSPYRKENITEHILKRHFKQSFPKITRFEVIDSTDFWSSYISYEVGNFEAFLDEDMKTLSVYHTGAALKFPKFD